MPTRPQHRPDPAHVRSVREALGLASDDLARILEVRSDTVRRWETGREPVPYGVRDELHDLIVEHLYDVEVLTGQLEAAAAAGDYSRLTVQVWRTDTGYHAAYPSHGQEGRWRPARWWRTIAARAVMAVPTARIVEGRHLKG